MSDAFKSDDPIFQKIRIGPHAFPGIWQYMLPSEILTMDTPEERLSTCMSCPKVRDDGFLPDYRCCTYHPRIPNFSLGLALQTADGKRGIAKAKTMQMLTPEGMAQSPKQYMDYLENLKGDAFGISTKVQCPMLEESTGFCNVHAFRNSVCSTFFCHNDHGSTGENFWGKFQGLVAQIEIALSQWCMTKLGIPLNEYVDVFAFLSQKIDQVSDPKKGGFSSKALKMLWGSYFGREEEFFASCAKLISDHREVLWEIANEFDIVDAQAFDIALLRSVPKSLRDQVDEADWEVGGVALRPNEMWNDLRRSYAKLWSLPTKAVKLSNLVSINSNPLKLQRDMDNQDKPYLLTKHGDTGLALFLTRAEVDLLQEFSNPRAITADLLMSTKARAVPTPKRFLAEALGRRILI